MQIRHRTAFVVVGTLIGLAASLWLDPDGGRSTALAALGIVQGVWAVAAAHWARKAILDHEDADWRMLFTMASTSATGAGLALIAGAIVFVGLLMVFAPRAHAADIVPKGWYVYGSTLQAEQKRYWPQHPDPALLGALVEVESCVSLRSPTCWNPRARLKSAREEGAGMGQITRAYRADGSLRFDALSELTQRYGDLAGLSWGTVYSRPDLQLRAMVLMSRDAARSFGGDALAFGDAAYNGGIGGVKKERQACKLTAGCDPAQWFGHVELHCLKSRQPLYGTRNACDINREHVRQVMQVRAPKYRALWGAA